MVYGSGGSGVVVVYGRGGVVVVYGRGGVVVVYGKSGVICSGDSFGGRGADGGSDKINRDLYDYVMCGCINSFASCNPRVNMTPRIHTGYEHTALAVAMER